MLLDCMLPCFDQYVVQQLIALFSGVSPHWELHLFSERNFAAGFVKVQMTNLTGIMTNNLMGSKYEKNQSTKVIQSSKTIISILERSGHIVSIAR